MTQSSHITYADAVRLRAAIAGLPTTSQLLGNIPTRTVDEVVATLHKITAPLEDLRIKWVRAERELRELKGGRADLLAVKPTRSEDGVTYEPWTNGHALGFKVTHDDGRVEYLYLNPSGGSDDGVPTVFLYQGTDGGPDVDEPVTHVELFQTP